MFFQMAVFIAINAGILANNQFIIYFWELMQ
jgi:hypothetical protein